MWKNVMKIDEIVSSNKVFIKPIEHFVRGLNLYLQKENKKDWASLIMNWWLTCLYIKYLFTLYFINKMCSVYGTYYDMYVLIGFQSYYCGIVCTVTDQFNNVWWWMLNKSMCNIVYKLTMYWRETIQFILIYERWTHGLIFIRSVNAAGETFF